MSDRPLMLDGFDAAVIGITSRCGQMDLVVYDRGKVISLLEKTGMSHEMAVEYYEFNIEGAWAGPGTPLFLDKMPAKKVREFMEDEYAGTE